MRIPSYLTATLLLLRASALAQQNGTAPAASSQEIPALIKQLGDDSYQVRQRAYARLRELGGAARPELREAEKSNDPEIHERAQDLVAELQTPRMPLDLPEAPPQGNGRFNSNFVRSENQAGNITLDAIESGRSIHIDQTANGRVHMVVRGEIHGVPATRDYKAASPAELKEGNPRAYQLYVECMAMVGGSNAMNWGVAQPGMRPIILPNGRAVLPVLPAPRPVVVAAPKPAAEQDLDRLERQLFDQMAQAHLTIIQRNTVTDLLRKVRAVRVPGAAGAEQDRLMEEYNRRSDDLRKQLQALNLPDPADALPPPESARLGISIAEGADGLLVTHILPNSRGKELGLQEGDVIQKIGGQPVRSVREMRTRLSGAGADLVVEVERDFALKKLEEKKNSP